MEKYGYVKSRCVWFYNGYDMFRDYINSLKLEVTQEMHDRHWSEWRNERGFTDKSKYSNRANIDSEYLEDSVIENVEEAVRLVGQDKYKADIKYRNMRIDFKEIASQYWYLPKDPIIFLQNFQKHKLSHFLFFKSNRPRYNTKEYRNQADVIEPGFVLQFEYLGCYDVMQVLNNIENYKKFGRVRIETLQEKYGTV